MKRFSINMNPTIITASGARALVNTYKPKLRERALTLIGECIQGYAEKGRTCIAIKALQEDVREKSHCEVPVSSVNEAIALLPQYGYEVSEIIVSWAKASGAPSYIKPRVDTGVFCDPALLNKKNVE
jgi:hypothetical protein